MYIYITYVCIIYVLCIMYIYIYIKNVAMNPRLGL